MTAKTGKPVGRPANIETVVARAVKAAVETATGLVPTGRTKSKIQNRYDAAGQGRRMVGWNPPRTSPNTAMVGVERLRERSRDSTRNDWAAGSLVQKWTTSLVGIGITPRFKRIKSKTRKQELTRLFMRWSAVADADCMLDYFGLQTLAVRTWFDGGECFVRQRRRFPDEGLPAPLQVQLLEADMCPMLDAKTYEGLPEGNEIRSGVEFNKRGKRTAYWFFKNHPGENAISFDGKELVRVAASEVTHVFEPKRPGQIRGISEAANILARLRNVADYEDATLERQKIANLFVAFLTRKLPVFDPNADGADPLSGAPLDEDYDLEPRSAPPGGLQPGLFQTLEDGEDVKFSNPPEAGTNYGEYMRTSHLGTSAGGGLPYELMSGDIMNVSDRTLRVIMNEFRRLAEQRQWQIVIPMFCQRVIEWWVDASVLVGTIALSEVEDVKEVEHSPHGWPDIHPTQDIEGRIKQVEAGHRSLSSVISARGDDPDQVADEMHEDDQRMQRLKIGPYSTAKAAENAPPPAPAPAPAPAPGPDDEPPAQE